MVLMVEMQIKPHLEQVAERERRAAQSYAFRRNQAIGLVILSKILFGGFHGGPRGMHWRHRMMERLDKMTPEERERFREGIRNTFGGFDAESSKPSAQSSG